jgi:hypothetical protein
MLTVNQVLRYNPKLIKYLFKEKDPQKITQNELRVKIFKLTETEILKRENKNTLNIFEQLMDIGLITLLDPKVITEKVITHKSDHFKQTGANIGTAITEKKFFLKIPTKQITEKFLLARDTFGETLFHWIAFQNQWEHVPTKFFTPKILLTRNNSNESILAQIYIKLNSNTINHFPIKKLKLQHFLEPGKFKNQIIDEHDDPQIKQLLIKKLVSKHVTTKPPRIN